MKLYVGGAFQGQEEMARAENPGAELFLNFHDTIWQAAENGEDPREFAARFCREHPDAVVAANEVGAGVVPMEKSDRMFREAAGRGLCVIAQQAETVTRVTCGIGMKLK